MMRIFVFTVFATCISVHQLNAQKLTSARVQQIVNSRHYMFEAQTMNPQGGASRQLNTEYLLKISGDTLTSYLPYFGRAYTAPVNASDAGYDFSTTHFDYAVSVGKKNRYEISIKTKDRTNNTNFLLTVFENGNASLQVNSSYRQPISFTGYMK